MRRGTAGFRVVALVLSLLGAGGALVQAGDAGETGVAIPVELLANPMSG